MKVTIQKNGQLCLPEEYIRRYKLSKGAELYLEPTEEGFFVSRPKPDVKAVYIEPTSRCNLNCITCVRNAWEENTGDMEMETFNLIKEQLRDFTGLHAVTFGGFGEPLLNPDILQMVKDIKDFSVELTINTNGTLLAPIAEALVQLKVDNIIVSIDSVKERDFSEIRKGASLKDVVENVKILNETKRRIPKVQE
jgi:MoaA/NifB/PqqE/SkfB family radical SAM enzyme